MKSNRNFFITAAGSLFLVVYQSTLVRLFSVDMVIPDLALIVTSFYAVRNGMMQGQLLGFSMGLAEDFLSVSPPGFNAMIKTVLGFFSGYLRNKIIFDPVIFPLIFILIITVFKGLLASFINLMFFEPGSSVPVFTRTFLFEIVINSLLAPPVFHFMKLFRLIPGDIWGNQK